jgi:hypothetical protein
METTNQKLTEISKIVCNYYDFPFESFELSSNRKRPLPKLRQIVCLIAKKHLSISFRELAEFLKKKNHSTIYLTVKSLREQMEFDKSLKNEVDEIEILIIESGLSKKSFQKNEWFDLIDLSNCIVFRMNKQSILFSNYTLDEVNTFISYFNIPEYLYEVKKYTETNTFIYKSNKNENN